MSTGIIQNLPIYFLDIHIHYKTIRFNQKLNQQSHRLRTGQIEFLMARPKNVSGCCLLFNWRRVRACVCEPASEYVRAPTSPASTTLVVPIGAHY